MAWLEKRGDGYRVKFRFGGREHRHTLKKVTGEREARALMGTLEENLILVERGKMDVPPGADLGLFLVTAGKLTQTPTVGETVTLGGLFTKYRESGCGKEANTRDTEAVHMRHLERLLGARMIVQGLTLEALQGYVNRRAEEGGMRGKVAELKARLSHTNTR